MMAACISGFKVRNAKKQNRAGKISSPFLQEM